MEVLKIDRVLVADYALREGLLYELIGRIRDSDPRDAAVTALMEKYHVDRQQVGRVEKVASGLFEQVSEAWKLGSKSRNWLSWGVNLHEVGLTISHHGYHRHGAYLIENSDLPGFSRKEQLILATLIRQHRRKPDSSNVAPMLEKIRLTIFRIAALLRLAVLINRTRSNRPVPPISVRANKERMRLCFPTGWLETHPLTLADLELEVGPLKRLGVRLEFC
jgi:exopolyphosphatase/guanosine-5'-triphosphate,3'-diphosphate pyrophosphatase